MPFDNSVAEALDRVLYPEKSPTADRHQTLCLLRLARDRLATPGVWLKGGEEGHASRVPGGWRFCARGVAVHVGMRMYDTVTVAKAIAALATAIPGFSLYDATPYTGVAEYNDRGETTLADVLAMYDRAIAIVEAELRPAMA